MKTLGKIIYWMICITLCVGIYCAFQMYQDSNQQMLDIIRVDSTPKR